MREEHQKIIEDGIKDTFLFREKYLDFEREHRSQLLLAQLDFFKVIASLVIGVSGILYFYAEHANHGFLGISFIFAFIALLFCVSYTREQIDLSDAFLRKTKKDIWKKTEDSIQASLKALREDNSDIFFKFAETEMSDKESKSQLNYIGELVVFCFYLSVGLLMFSYLAMIYSFTVLSLQTVALIAITYLLSFKNWSVKTSEVLSKSISEFKTYFFSS